MSGFQEKSTRHAKRQKQTVKQQQQKSEETKTS